MLEAVSPAPGGGQGEQHEDGGEGGQTQQQHDVVTLRPRPQTCPAIGACECAGYLISRAGYCCRAGSRRRTPRRRGRRRAARGTPRSTSPAGTWPRTPAPAAWADMWTSLGSIWRTMTKNALLRDITSSREELNVSTLCLEYLSSAAVSADRPASSHLGCDNSSLESRSRFLLIVQLSSRDCSVDSVDTPADCGRGGR